MSVTKELKQSLESVVLEILETQSMCGYDIIKVLFQRYGLFISPGRIYPLLSYLEGLGILKSEIGGRRSKVYYLARK
ncbi:MAG: PadR family transcriptional regulator [Candidatus Thermoplasmatota archaeon]|nr:PadR family transcriptional regulator [Candidatus Thermoplasmatota archaeon]